MPTRLRPAPSSRALSSLSPAGALLQQVRDVVRWNRRALGAALLALALLSALSSITPSEPTTAPVLVAAHDLEAGAALEARDLRITHRAEAEIPESALDPAAPPWGRVIALPIRAGEVLTDVRLIGPGLLDGLGPDVVAAPVHLADDAAGGVPQVGDLVDVLGAGEAGGAVVAATEARVLATPAADVVVLAVASRTAARLASVAATSRLTLLLRGSGNYCEASNCAQ